MKMHFLAALGAAVFFSMPVRAEQVRFPQTGAPAFVITTPDGWTHQPDGDGNMLLISGNKTASYALTIGSYSGNLDDLATGAMKAAGANAPQQMGPTIISGFRGYEYDSSMVNPSGVHVNVHMVAVKTDAGHMASVTMLTVDGIASEDYQAAQSVLANTSIVGP
ncbi:MAG TPA: hypothetical protein VJ476_00120 [Rhizomicrobium sp.]|nr:hypothetical protein [Rhizomicrobium sp.]